MFKIITALFCRRLCNLTYFWLLKELSMSWSFLQMTSRTLRLPSKVRNTSLKRSSKNWICDRAKLCSIRTSSSNISIPKTTRVKSFPTNKYLSLHFVLKEHLPKGPVFFSKKFTSALLRRIFPSPQLGCFSCPAQL